MTQTTKLSENLLDINWPAKNVLAFSTTRLPPKFQLSNYPPNTLTGYDAFNVGDHVGDCPIKVASNRKHLLSFLPDNSKIQWLEQVHGNNVVDIIDYCEKPIVADAAITRQKNIALAVMTADCLPILLTNKEGSEIAVIHAGWRPLSANIIARTLAKMKSTADDIHVWLGPCIGPSSFEVGQEVKQKFCETSNQFETAFVPLATKSANNIESKYFANLTLIAQLQLCKLGVNQITVLAECTFLNNNKFYSYRRDGKTGRMVSVICLF